MSHPHCDSLLGTVAEIPLRLCVSYTNFSEAHALNEKVSWKFFKNFPEENIPSFFGLVIFPKQGVLAQFILEFHVRVWINNSALDKCRIVTKFPPLPGHANPKGSRKYGRALLGKCASKKSEKSERNSEDDGSHSSACHKFFLINSIEPWMWSFCEDFEMVQRCSNDFLVYWPI